MSSDPRALTRSPSARRGSTLLLTLVLLLALALVMASTLPSVLTQYRLEHQQTLGVTAFNLAEGGAEVALWTLAQSTEAAALAEAGWELDEDGDFYFRELSLADLGGDALAPVTAQVRVVFTQPADTSLVRIYALARVTTPGSRETVTRRVVVEAEIGAPASDPPPFTASSPTDPSPSTTTISSTASTRRSFPTPTPRASTTARTSPWERIPPDPGRSTSAPRRSGGRCGSRRMKKSRPTPSGDTADTP
jgi:hypothetical protein